MEVFGGGVDVICGIIKRRGEGGRVGWVGVWTFGSPEELGFGDS